MGALLASEHRSIRGDRDPVRRESVVIVPLGDYASCRRLLPAVSPPSMAIEAPETNRDSSEAR